MSEADASALAELAIDHRVPGYALSCDRLERSGEPYARLKVARYAAAAEHLRVLDAVRWLGTAMPSGVDWVVLKGPVLSAAHGGAGLRSFGDLDVLVPPEQFPAVVEALTNGGGSMTVDWAQLFELRAAEVPLTAPNGCAVDLHWHLVHDRLARDAVVLPTDELIQRSRRIEVPGGNLVTLDAVDTFLHVVHHAAVSGGDKLVWLKDIERCWFHFAPDPDLVRIRAERARLGLVLDTMLSRVARTLSPGLGPGPSRELLASLWRSLDRSAFRGWEKRGAPLSSARLVARSTRHTPRDSIVELGCRVRSHARQASLGKLGEDRGKADREVGVGDTTARQRYLRAVRQGQL